MSPINKEPLDIFFVEVEMEQRTMLMSPALRVRTEIKSGYWTCTGVQGQQDWRGYYLNGATAALCYKPKYAPIFGAPALYGGDN